MKKLSFLPLAATLMVVVSGVSSQAADAPLNTAMALPRSLDNYEMRIIEVTQAPVSIPVE